jgi:hypothetical protein
VGQIDAALPTPFHDRGAQANLVPQRAGWKQHVLDLNLCDFSHAHPCRQAEQQDQAVTFGTEYGETLDTLRGKDANGAGVEARSVRPGIDRIALSAVAPSVAEPFCPFAAQSSRCRDITYADWYGRERLLSSRLRLAVELVSRMRWIKCQKLDTNTRFFAIKILMNLFLYALSALQRP